ncbi:hypothetical protein F5882DRAFT_401372 [Hyaloscypha sp. PMI_1271]|nr:hypothetical protein F5882DRAFT_401372 [Hyaloscypha sp. PMI_1271]
MKSHKILEAVDDPGFSYHHFRHGDVSHPIVCYPLLTYASAHNLHHMEPAEVAADSDCYEICSVLLDEIKADLDVAGGHWGTALLAAAAFGHEKIVRLCLSSGAEGQSKS